jgi:hypothetical protein
MPGDGEEAGAAFADRADRAQEGEGPATCQPRLLAPDNFHVSKDLKKVADGRLLSPVLLVRDTMRHEVPLIVADGYHRICGSYHLDEDADIPCRIADLTPA